MLQITVPATEFYDDKENRFIEIKEHHLRLEHSLVSVSKWESYWEKPFISSSKNETELRDYIRFMTLTQNVDPRVYFCLTDENFIAIRDYIDAPMTATTISEVKGKNNREIITSEIIYYWMISFNIPFECEKWHLNRLLMLIRVCSIKNQPKKKPNQRSAAQKRKAINDARRMKHNTRG